MTIPGHDLNFFLVRVFEGEEMEEGAICLSFKQYLRTGVKDWRATRLSRITLEISSLAGKKSKGKIKKNSQEHHQFLLISHLEPCPPF